MIQISMETKALNEAHMQHGIDWSGENLAGWIINEKFNGCRAYWDGANLWSRGGMCVDLPASWREQLPQGMHLDCELYYGKDGVYKCGAALRYGRFLPGMVLIVFDAPTPAGGYLQRLRAAAKATASCQFVRIPECTVALDTAQVMVQMTQLQAAGGEGLMARQPDLAYSPGRTGWLLKVTRDARHARFGRIA